MTPFSFGPPRLIVHCDWGTEESKRWMACANLGKDGHYTAETPEPVGKLGSLLTRLRRRGSDMCSILIGFDFPIGLPAAYAEKTGEQSFLQMLPILGQGKWNQFYHPANQLGDVDVYRPFYPDKPGKKGEKPQLPFLGALKVTTANDLRRSCELQQPGRTAACPLFWTVGGNQVGKSAIRGWREVLAPALKDPSVKIWPFHGPLTDILRPGATVIAETYPTQYHQRLFGHPFTGKRLPSRRKSEAETWITRAREWDIRLDRELKRNIEDGFPPHKNRSSVSAHGNESRDSEDDRFDAAIGLFGMIDSLQQWSRASEPGNDKIRNIEGWILGQS